MKNRVEADSSFTTIELMTYVAKLLQLTKAVAYNANDLKYPTMQAVKALKSLLTAQQHNEEHLVDCYKCFVSLNKMADRAYGDIAPVVVAKKNTTAFGKDLDGTLLAEKNWMLAYLFMDGADKKIHGCMLKNISNNHALRTEKYPADVESALQIMMLCSEGISKKLADKKRHKQLEDKSPQLGGIVQMSKNKMRQKGLCFKCKKHGHTADKCPDNGNSGNDGNGAAQMVQMTDEEQVYSWMNN